MPLDFWETMDQLVTDSRIVIDRPRYTPHPRYPDLIYPVDYGYLDNTTSMDGGGIDVWLGTDSTNRPNAIICTVDTLKRDSEIKILIGCTEDEIQTIYRFLNDGAMSALLIRRELS
jgi:inorganic pyrophosphatase